MDSKWQVGRSALAAVVLASLLLGGAVSSVLAWSEPCSGTTANKYLGNGKSASGLIGYAKCPKPEVGTCPYNDNNSYYWVFYAHEQGPVTGSRSLRQAA